MYLHEMLFPDPRAVPRGSGTEAREARAMALHPRALFTNSAEPPLCHLSVKPFVFLGLSSLAILANVRAVLFPDPWRSDRIPRAVPRGSKTEAREARTKVLLLNRNPGDPKMGARKTEPGRPRRS